MWHHFAAATNFKTLTVSLGHRFLTHLVKLTPAPAATPISKFELALCRAHLIVGGNKTQFSYQFLIRSELPRCKLRLYPAGVQ